MPRGCGLPVLVAAAVLQLVVTVAQGQPAEYDCLPAQNVTLRLVDHDNDGVPSVGDCLRYPEDVQSTIDFSPPQASTASIPGTLDFGSFVTNETCGGLTLTAILTQKEVDMAMMSLGTGRPQSELPANATCPDGEIAVVRNIDARITTTTERGAGRAAYSCDQYGPDWERSGLLCYPKCKAGYSGNGPLCLTNCAPDFQDIGQNCRKPASRVALQRNSRGFGRCPPGFQRFGCCICRPACPSGQTDIGFDCQKGSYERGAGMALGCADGEDYDAGLCYRSCPGGNGVGPLCYSACTTDQPFRLGILCYQNRSQRDRDLGAIIGGAIGGEVVLRGLTLTFAPLIIAAGGAVHASGPATIATGPTNSVVTFSTALAAAA